MCSAQCISTCINWFVWFSVQAVLDDFDYSDDEDSLDRASRLARQKEREKEREALNQPPLPHTLDKLAMYFIRWDKCFNFNFAVNLEAPPTHPR